MNPQELERAHSQLQAPGPAPSGRTNENLNWSHVKVSQELSRLILEKFRAHPLWLASMPVLLGSWGRGELTPKSDLDLLFAGPAETVFSLVTDLQNQGYRIRYRIPEDPGNWSIGVESADCLSLWQAAAETPEAEAQLAAQQKKIFSDRKVLRKILKDLLKERKQRALRFDSIESFLEPNLKYGAGGLRDLFQGRVLLALFPEKFETLGPEMDMMEYYTHFFLTVRQKLHFSGYSDVLAASEQFEIAKWFGYESHSEFMRQIQRGLARSHFYSEWILHKILSSNQKLEALQKKKFKKPQDLLGLLLKDSSILAQYRVRSSMDAFEFPIKARGEMLKKVLSSRTPDATLQAVFRSRLIDKICPRIRHLIGLVQHDQYHRFTADAHLLQACREVHKIEKKASHLGPMKSLHKRLSPSDWKILSWAALYHDLAKGLPGDHSELGEQWAKEDLKAFGFSSGFREEVAWLVRNHLELSTAAFRKNPHSPETWQALQDLGLDEKRLLRLALWTVLDIRATNPEAWNDWKAKLLLDLVEKILAGGTQNFLKLKKKLPAKLSAQVVDALDPQLFESFRAEVLEKDLKSVAHGEGSWVILKDSRRKLWIRFHERHDRPGLLSECLEKIYASGASIQHALVHTLPEVGVYDWFQVQTGKEPAQLLKLLNQLKASSVSAPKVQFMSIDFVSQSESEWVLSFRGLDQKGLLLGAALRLKELGAQIRSARVHTWGRQIEDLFHVEPLKKPSAEFLNELRDSLMKDSREN